jgi:serine/threonine protein kinase
MDSSDLNTTQRPTGRVSSPDSPAIAPGSFDRYRLVRWLGHGRMATVFLVRQDRVDRDLALKRFRGFDRNAPARARRFLREVPAADVLSHRNVLTAYERFEDRGVPYIAMEYVPRGSLRPHVARLTLAQFAGVMEGVLAGLTHAQTRGIVHRNLKPENIMVTGEGRVKVADFGIAKAIQVAGAGALATATGMTVGTPAYMAPEQAVGEEVGTWTDLYSVGVMAWEHVVGRVPFPHGSPAAVLIRQVNQRIPSATELRPESDPDVSAWIDRLLVKDPHRRPSDPSAVWSELEEIVVSRLGPLWRRDARLVARRVTCGRPVEKRGRRVRALKLVRGNHAQVIPG